MNEKIRNNAISAYLWMGGLLLLPTKNEYIKNSFVRSHAKMAVFLHSLFLLNYIIFIYYKLFSQIHVPIIWSALNHSIAAVLFLILFWILLYWCFQAKNGNTFWKSELSQLTHTTWLIEMKNSNLNEEGNLTFILSYFPIIGYYIYSKFAHYNNNVLISNVKINFTLTLILFILLLQWYGNLVSFLFLAYIIGAIFLSISLVVQQKIIYFQTHFLPSIEEIYVYNLTIWKYLQRYFSKTNTFLPFSEIKKQTWEKYGENTDHQQKIYSSLPQGRLPFFLYYVPYINIISIIDYHSKHKNHIINGWILTVASILFFLTNTQDLHIFLAICIAYWLWAKENFAYRFFFVSQLYDILILGLKKAFSLWKKTKKLKDEVTHISYDINK